MYESAGYYVEETEYGTKGKRSLKKDFLGFSDHLAFQRGFVTAIQSTSYEGMSARKKKILSEPRALLFLWIGENHFIHLVGWKREVVGLNTPKPFFTWEPFVTQLFESDFPEDTINKAKLLIREN